MEEKLRIYPQQKKDLEILISQINGENLTLVEIGSYMGESMEIFAKSGKFSKIICIDPWINGFDDTDQCSHDCENAENNFDQRKLNFDFVEKIKDKNENVVFKFEDKSLDMVYVDGKHTPEDVRKDIESWLPKIKDSGYISGHDWYLKGGILQESITSAIGVPDFICGHPIHGTEGDGSWVKLKSNIK